MPKKGKIRSMTKLQCYNREKDIFSVLIKRYLETSLVVQWLRLHTPNAEGPGSIPGQEINRVHIPQLRIHMSQQRPSAVK